MKNLEKSIDKDNMKCAESEFVKEKELDTTQTWITDKMDEIELDQIEPTKSDHCKRVRVCTFEIPGPANVQLLASRTF